MQLEAQNAFDHDKSAFKWGTSQGDVRECQYYGYPLDISNATVGKIYDFTVLGGTMSAKNRNTYHKHNNAGTKFKIKINP
jgi:hypothetical protein